MFYAPYCISSSGNSRISMATAPFLLCSPGRVRTDWLIYDLPSTVPVGRDGRRPFWRQRKYTATGNPITVAKGAEMRLIEAEAALLGGDLTGALNAINAVRTHHYLPHLTAATADEAWEILVRERGLELWLEGRRLADLRRWQQNPGWVRTEVVRYGGPRNVLDTEEPLCLKVSSNEIFSNPNIPSTPYQ